MTQQRKTYTREFKLEAIQLAETSGKPVTQIERELGLGKSQIYRWKRQLEMQMTRATFDTWLKPTTLLPWAPDGNNSGIGSMHIVLGVPDRYVKDWLENRLYTPIQRTLHGIVGEPVKVEVEVIWFRSYSIAWT